MLISSFFFFNDTAPPEIYTLSLHDALPISVEQPWADRRERPDGVVATMAAGPDVQAAWEHAGRPGVLALLSDDPDPVAVRLDLRPWGHDRLKLAEPDAAGLAPRPDLFPRHNPLG